MGRIVYVGLDVSSQDWSSFVLLFPPPPGEENRHHRASFHFFVPEETIQSGSADFSQWNNRFTVMPGEVVDYDFILTQIRNAVQSYPRSPIGVDPWGPLYLRSALELNGLKADNIKMSYDDMFAPTMRMRLLIESGMLATDNPVFDWMLGNLRLMQRADGCIKPDVSHSTGCISGVLSLIRALAAMMKDESLPQPATPVTSTV